MESNQKSRRKYGNLRCFFYKKQTPVLCIGPHCKLYTGPFFICLLAVLCLLGVFFLFYICPTLGKLNTALGAIVFTFLIGSYMLAALVNPGIEEGVDKDIDLEAEDTENYCSICKIFVSDKTFHCDECDVCIKDYDHHCPWTSKCIGCGNLYFFYTFLTSLLIFFVFGVITMAFQPKGKN